MILAAGLGTRLGSITRETPKALVEVGGIPMLERVARRLIESGVDRLIVNVHHHGRRIEHFIARQGGFGVAVRISHEEHPLETGGGLQAAAALFEGRAPFFLHNVDVLTDLDLRAMYEAHVRSGALVTVAVNERETSRYLLFDDGGLVGRVDLRSGQRREVRPARGPVRPLAFAGIHVISAQFLSRMTETGVFSILEPYLRLAAAGHSILPYPMGDRLWLEVGTPERLAAARRHYSESAD